MLYIVILNVFLFLSSGCDIVCSSAGPRFGELLFFHFFGKCCCYKQTITMQHFYNNIQMCNPVLFLSFSHTCTIAVTHWNTLCHAHHKYILSIWNIKYLFHNPSAYIQLDFNNKCVT